jgi:hypothetical protein
MRELLPWRDLAIETSWPPSVAAIEIRKRISEPRALANGDEPFLGGPLGEHEFRFRLHRSQEFPLTVHARVEEGPRGGACVRVRMRLPDVAAIAFLAWATIATLFALEALIRGQILGLLAPVLIVAVIRVVTLPFVFAAREAERILREVFAAAPALPDAPNTGEPYR